MTDFKKDTGNGMTYRESGVDIAAGNALVKAIAPLAAATRRSGATAELGGFGGAFDLAAAGYADPILIAATDGVGTKLNVAFATGQHETIGIDLVAMCVNDLVAQGAEPLFFLDYFATGKLDKGVAERVVSGIAEGCRMAGAALIGGETAEMPGLYSSGHYDLAGFAVGAAERDRLLPRSDMRAGDSLLGFASSGVHSNGFSLVRKIVEVAGLDWSEDAPFKPDTSLGAALLAPTRIYARSIIGALGSSSAIKGLAHITGGGLTENVPRCLPENTCAEIDLNALPRTEVFGWLAQKGGVARDEMLLTFNCGIGMVAVVEAEMAGSVQQNLEDAGESVCVLGQIAPSSGSASVRYTGMPWWEA